MSRGLIGKKLGMTAVFASDGRHVPVTVLEMGPCVITQIKTAETDGYNALQLGFGVKKAIKMTRPMEGHLGKSGGGRFQWLREVPVENPSDFSLGQSLSVDLFNVGERVHVIGTTKGRGFAGVVKRHNKKRGRKTHGSHSYRAPGSVGSSAWPSRVMKGKHMPGHYGNDRRTVKNLEIVDIRPAENVMLIKGAVPGAAMGLVMIHKPPVD